MNWFQCAQRAFLACSAVLTGTLLDDDRVAAPRRALAFEPLEPRLALSAAGLVEVGTQPEGGLSEKIVYVHAGHGYTANNLGNGAWSFQRPNLLGMIEDLGNHDQMTLLVDYLWNAGATIVPLRPVGHQTNEVIVDNVDANVEWVGTWLDSSGSVYFGNPGEVPYRFATTSLTETAYARYRPDIPETGHYPLYTWVVAGGNRASDQLYRVNHAGGITEVTVNHRRVGHGLVYLGTFHFEAGTDGYVDISNRSSEPGRVVIADMLRFGNGMGDIDRGGGVSGLAREDEAGLYWVMWHVDRAQGISDSVYRTSNNDRTATVSLAPRYASFMNREQDGSLADRVFVSFHSNASTGNARGVLGLYNGNINPATATPNQFLLAYTLAREVNDDLVAQAGAFEHDWHDRGNNITLARSDIEFGEINNLRGIDGQFDATIIETGYHDNTLDAEMLRDPKVRDALARATYQGIVNYFREVDGNATPVTKAPPMPTDVRAESTGEGSVTVSWQPPPATSYGGDAATGFRIYVSTGGYGFDGGRVVSSGARSSVTLTGLDPELPYYFKVAAINEGGESPASEVMVAVPNGGEKQVLIVGGFDRIDRHTAPKQAVPSGPPVDRARPLDTNSRDYVVQHASAIYDVAPGVRIDSTSNEAVVSGAVDLADYHTVVWILGNESTADSTFDATEQALAEQFIAGGGNLLVSGAEIGTDLDAQNNGREFYHDTLLATHVANDAGTYSVQGVRGNIFTGLNFSFDDGTLFYDVGSPDVIAPRGGAKLALNYANGAGAAAIQAQGTEGRGSVVLFAFPFETITTAEDRAAVMDRVLEFFGVAAIVPDNADFNNDGMVDAADYTVWRDRLGLSVTPGGPGDANHDGQVDQHDHAIWRSQFGSSAAAGAASGAALTASLLDEPFAATATASDDDAARHAAFGMIETGSGEDRPWQRPLAVMSQRWLSTAEPMDWAALIAAITERAAANVPPGEWDGDMVRERAGEQDAATDSVPIELALRSSPLDKVPSDVLSSD